MRVKEGVNALNFLPVGNQSAGKTAKSDGDAGKLDFSSFLAGFQNDSTKNTLQNTGTKQSDIYAGEGSRNIERKEDADAKKMETEAFDTTKAEVPEETKAVEDAETPEESLVEMVSSDTGKETVEEEQAVIELVSSVLQIVMQNFQLSGEELADKLEEFGMEVTDLLNTDGIKEFFLNMKSADVSDLIVDEDLNQELQTLIEDFNELLETTDMKETDLSALPVKEDVLEEITDFPRLQSMVADDFKKSSLDVSDETEKPVDAEPEVIVTGREEKKLSNQNNYSEENNEDSQEEMPEQNMEVEKSIAVSKQKGFEDPILQAISEAVDQVEEVVVSEQPVTGQDIISQVVEQIRVNMNQDHTSLELQLYPEHLGKIQINVVSKDGIMTARIVAETEAAKQAIEGGLTNLKESMQQQDLKVDAIEVMVSTTGFERGNEEQNSFGKENASKSRRKIDLSELEEDISDSEDAEAEKMKQMGSSVSYTA